MALLKRFKADQRGTTAMIFGLAFLPIIGFAGAAIDYSRATMTRTEMQSALDLAALTIVKLPFGTSQAAIDKLAADTLEARMGMTIGARSQSGVTIAAPTVTRSGKTVNVKTTATADSAFLQVLGFGTLPIGAESQAIWSAKKIELALVLDNTGSMADSIGGGRRKIDALKDSATQLLTDLRSSAKETDTVKVSVVPFDTEVRLDPATYRSKSWFDWTRLRTDPAKWTGYVFDRWNGYATTDAAPSIAVQDSLFPAPQDTTSRMAGSLQMIRPLTSLYDSSNFTTLKGVVSGMTPRGYTNIALGIAWGLSTLTPSDPFTEAQPATNKDVKKYMVVLTDGDNTMNHVNGAENFSVGQIDTKTLTICTAAKTAGIEIFTIRLVSGNAGLLQSCASSSVNYFDVQNATQLGKAFQTILDSISGTRISS